MVEEKEERNLSVRRHFHIKKKEGTREDQKIKAGLGKHTHTQASKKVLAFSDLAQREKSRTVTD